MQQDTLTFARVCQYVGYGTVFGVEPIWQQIGAWKDPRGENNYGLGSFLAFIATSDPSEGMAGVDGKALLAS